MFNLEDKNNPCVSVILPCYNVEQYLREALDSVLAQTLSNIEIIPVDDGSPDNCAEIIKEYAQKDSRIKPIFKENGGYGTAVNAGLKIATGEYIAILEPDDYVMEDYYYILYHEAKKDDLDVCGVNAYCEIREMETPKLIQTPWIDNPDYLSFENVNKFFAFGTVGITLKIYKKSFLEKNIIKLREDIRAYHDVPFVAEVMLKSNKSRIIVGCGYFYRKDNIISTTKNKSSFYNIVTTIQHVLNLVDFYVKRDSRRSALLGFCVSHLIFYYKRILATSGNNTIISSMITEILLDIISNAKKININIVHQNFLLEFLPQHLLKKLEYLQSNIVNFDSCPAFDVTYFREQHSLSNTISELSFYIYFAITLNSLNQINHIRNRLYTFLSTFIGIKGKYIEDYILFYIQKNWFSFPRDWNSNWYLMFMSYMIDKNNNFLGRIYESVNHSNMRNTTVQFIPTLAKKFDDSYSYLNTNFRKAKLISRLSDNNQIKFLKYINKKSIAIVGNASSEISLGKGKEIDFHDIVIRFNNFSIEKQYIQDYGSKTNIWAITPSIETLFFQENFYDFDFVISPDLNFMLSEERIKILYSYIIAGGCFHYLNSIRCRRRFNINIPSIGLYVLFYLLENISKLGKVSLYGFSPLEAKKEVRHYFKDDPAKTSDLKFHDWDKEAVLINQIKEIFNKHNQGIK